MADIIGGAMMVVGGAAMSAGSVTCVRSLARRPLEAARQLLGDSTAATIKAVPADMAGLLDQIP